MVSRPEVYEEELLLPLGPNTLIIHNEQHTMSAMVVLLQINSTSLEKTCLLGIFKFIFYNEFLEFLIVYKRCAVS